MGKEKDLIRIFIDEESDDADMICNIEDSDDATVVTAALTALFIKMPSIAEQVFTEVYERMEHIKKEIIPLVVNQSKIVS